MVPAPEVAVDDNRSNVLYTIISDKSRNNFGSHYLNSLLQLLILTVITLRLTNNMPESVLCIEVCPRLPPRVDLLSGAAAGWDREAEDWVVVALGNGRGRRVQLCEL